MKQFYTALAFMAMTLFASAESYRSVAVNLTDGSKVEINLTDELSASFSETNLVVTGGDRDVSVPRSSIKSFTFSTKTGIESADATNYTPEISGGVMRFTNLPESTVISAYDIKGALLFQTVTSGEYTLDLTETGSTAVIVKVNETAYKIATTR